MSKSGSKTERPAEERAEEMVDLWGRRAGQLASELRQNLLKWTARAREEAEDMWAEAQSIHRDRTSR